VRVVIDTNVVVSAAIRDRQPETVILFIAEHPDWEWVASTEIVQEYNGVLRRAKFNLPESIIRKWTNLLDIMRNKSMLYACSLIPNLNAIGASFLRSQD
jgi:putative PIN family toxin of toxin-antitoxin system